MSKNEKTLSRRGLASSRTRRVTLVGVFAAIATVGDVMRLQDENRILVRYGLRRMAVTENIGLRKLTEKTGLDIRHLSAYHIGFVIGPCLNAGGRLQTAKLALRLLLAKDEEEADALAEELKNPDAFFVAAEEDGAFVGYAGMHCPMGDCYIDNIAVGLWSLIGCCAILFTAICLFMMLFAGKDCWIAMLVFGHLIIGMAVVVQGFVIQEKSLIAGGLFGVISGTVVMCFAIGGIPIDMWWAFPLIAVTFILMLIVPGHILNYKARKLCSKN